MNRCQKNLSILLIAILTLSGIASLYNVALAVDLENLPYGETVNKGNHDPLDIRFSELNNSVIYLTDKNWVNFSVGLGKYTFDYMKFKIFFDSVTYKASWQKEQVTAYSWSYHDPANQKDDDPNPEASFQGTISLNGAPLGNQQITLTAHAGCYATDFSTYSIITAETSQTLNITIASNSPQTPRPTINYDLGTKWRTDIAWNLTGTPAQNLWTSNIYGKGRSWTSPVIVDGVLYAGATSTVVLNQYGTPHLSWVNIYAFDVQTGKEKWNYHTVFSSLTGLVVADGRVYFGAEADFYGVQGNVNATESVNALNAATGKLLWSTPCDIFYSGLANENGRVFVNSGHSVLAFDGANGKVLWNFTANDIIVSGPTVTNGVLCIPSYDKTLYALNTADGSKRWSIKSDNGFSGCKAVDGVVYADSGDGKMNAYTVATGNKLWSQRISPPEFSWVNNSRCNGIAYYSGALYFIGSSDQSLEQTGVGVRGVSFSYGSNYVYALNVDSHGKIWNFTDHHLGFDGFMKVSGNVVFVGVYDGILGFNAQNGALIWNNTDPELGTNWLTVANGTIYAGFSDGQLYALNAPTVDFQTVNQGASFLNEANGILLLVISVNIGVTITVLVLYRNRKRGEKEAKND